MTTKPPSAVTRKLKRGLLAVRRTAKRSANHISRTAKWLAERVAYRKVQIVWAVGLFFLVLLWWWLPKWWVSSLRGRASPVELIETENHIRATVAQSRGGVLLLVGVYFAWRRLNAVEQDIQVAQESHITERFTKAVEQLGSKRLEIRLGAIYALERISADSEKDYWPIIEILTAYVRMRAPRRIERESRDAGADQHEPARALDIQAVLTVLGRRRHSFGDGERQRLDLARTDLREADLSDGHFEGAYLWGADLERASLLRTNLKRARLRGANLRGANLQDANLHGAHLRGAKLEGAKLQRAILAGAKLWYGKLVNASLSEANLKRAHLGGANLKGADLERANLREARLSRAKLESANLRGAILAGSSLMNANLKEAWLSGADLRGACFLSAYLKRANLKRPKRSHLLGLDSREANWSGAKLWYANLKGADLRKAAGLTPEQIKSAITNNKTLLPDYISAQVRERKPHGKGT